jgi:hypothetical protein
MFMLRYIPHLCVALCVWFTVHSYNVMVGAKAVSKALADERAVTAPKIAGLLTEVGTWKQANLDARAKLLAEAAGGQLKYNALKASNDKIFKDLRAGIAINADSLRSVTTYLGSKPTTTDSGFADRLSQSYIQCEQDLDLAITTGVAETERAASAEAAVTVLVK